MLSVDGGSNRCSIRVENSLCVRASRCRINRPLPRSKQTPEAINSDHRDVALMEVPAGNSELRLAGTPMYLCAW